MTTIIGSGNIPGDPNGRAIGDITALQFASITYCSLEDNVQSTLQSIDSLNGWNIVWKPEEEIGGNWAFIVQNGSQYVLAIRGSILQFSEAGFDNWFKQDFNLFTQVDWAYPLSPNHNIKISQGAQNGLQNLTQLKDTDGSTIWDFLKANVLNSESSLCVTGHSLGANLATIIAPWIKYQVMTQNQVLPTIFSVITFAAPTSWNADFAIEFDENFPLSWRYYNELDIVPMSATAIKEIGQMFPAPGIKAADIHMPFFKHASLQAFLDDEANKLEISQENYGSYYTRVNKKRGSVALNSQHYIFKESHLLSIENWLAEVAAQHDHNHYLDWLEGEEINCCD